MKQLKAYCAAIAVLLLGGCATQKDWLVTGGSRADGVVRLSYESNEFQRVNTSEEQASKLATQRCMAWGYKAAQSFGSQSVTCQSRRGLGNCGDRLVTVEYQCTGPAAQ